MLAGPSIKNVVGITVDRLISSKLWTIVIFLRRHLSNRDVYTAHKDFHLADMQIASSPSDPDEPGVRVRGVRMGRRLAALPMVMAKVAELLAVIPDVRARRGAHSLPFAQSGGNTFAIPVVYVSNECAVVNACLSSDSAHF